jgi:hypothetical protein
MMTQGTQKGTDGPSPEPGTRKGGEMADSDGTEPGRHEKGETGADRPAGGSTARDSTGINPEDRNPIDPDSPNLPPA